MPLGKKAVSRCPFRQSSQSTVGQNGSCQVAVDARCVQLEAPIDRDQKLRTLIKDCFSFPRLKNHNQREDSRRRRNISLMTSAFYFWVAAAAAAASVCCQLFFCPLTETNENKSQLLTKLNVYSSFVFNLG